MNLRIATLDTGKLENLSFILNERFEFASEDAMIPLSYIGPTQVYACHHTTLVGLVGGPLVSGPVSFLPCKTRKLTFLGEETNIFSGEETNVFREGN